ncbi:MAG: hypothetical protein ACI9M6_001690, partial [Hydrogenophaga sp.]
MSVVRVLTASPVLGEASVWIALRGCTTMGDATKDSNRSAKGNNSARPSLRAFS